MKTVSASEAISAVRSNDQVFVHTGMAIPQLLEKELANRHHDLRNVTIYQLNTEGEALYALTEYSESFKIRAFFVGKSTRKAVESNQGSYIPIFLSEIPALFRTEKIQLNVALISVSPPDKNGFCSLGPSVDITLAAIEMKN
jgi:4-hydroxybutyrate CoA-transferase